MKDKPKSKSKGWITLGKWLGIALTTVVVGTPTVDYYIEDEPQEIVFEETPEVEHEKWSVEFSFDELRETIKEPGLSGREYLDNRSIVLKIQSDRIPSDVHCMKEFRKHFQDSTIIYSNVFIQEKRPFIDHSKKQPQ